MCCICRANAPVERYVLVLEGHHELDSDPVERAMAKLLKYVEKRK